MVLDPGGAVGGAVGTPPEDGGGAGAFGPEGGAGGTGEVDPFGATGPDSSPWARKLIRTVSFFRGTVEVLEEGFGGSWSLIRIKFYNSDPYSGLESPIVSTA